MFEIYLEIEPDLIIESSNKDKLTIEKLNNEKSELDMIKDEQSRTNQMMENLQTELTKLQNQK